MSIVIMIGLMILLAGCAACVAANIWLLIIAFQTSILWGIGLLFVLPEFLFVLIHWQKTKKAVFLYLSGMALIFAGYVATESYLQSKIDEIRAGPFSVAANTAPQCYWLQNSTGEFTGESKWVIANTLYQKVLSKKECFELDSCSGGKGSSQGGCYKWAYSADSLNIPWSEEQSAETASAEAADLADSPVKAAEISLPDNPNAITQPPPEQSQQQSREAVNTADDELEVAQANKRKIEIARSGNGMSVAEKELAFKKAYKPRPECTDSSLSWEKIVECSDTKAAARKEFFKTH